jgi:hypothetical protein
MVAASMRAPSWRRVSELADVSVLKHAVVTSEDGRVVYDLGQQDMVAVRVAFGEWAAIIPATRLMLESRAGKRALARAVVKAARHGPEGAPFLERLEVGA